MTQTENFFDGLVKDLLEILTRKREESIAQVKAQTQNLAHAYTTPAE